MSRELTQDRLRELLRYDPETGFWTWLSAKGAVKPGDVAGNETSEGYWTVCIDKKRYRSGRLAWFYMTGAWPTLDVDHIDADKLNDRWSNLREATRSQNMANRGANTNSASGSKGVIWSKNRWQAQIRVKGKNIYLGRFTAKHDAISAYAEAADRYCGEFARAA